MKLSTSWVRIIIVLFSVYLIWASATIYNLNTYQLAYYAVNPKHLGSDTNVFIPYTSRLLEFRLSSQSRAELEQSFRLMSLQPYSILSLYTFDESPDEIKKEKAFRITEMMMKKGLSLGLLDKYGCSSLHNAILNREIDITRHLLAQNAEYISEGYKESIIEECKLPVSQLLMNQ